MVEEKYGDLTMNVTVDRISTHIFEALETNHGCPFVGAAKALGLVWGGGRSVPCFSGEYLMLTATNGLALNDE